MDISTLFNQDVVHPLILYTFEYFAGLFFLYSAIKYFGKTGIFLFIVLSIQIANIQVLKATPLFDTSMALGTILFTLSYMATDLLADAYGRKTAIQGIWLGFFGTLMITFFMIITLIYPVQNEEYFFTNHQAMVHLFTPVPAILAASFIAYLISQCLDVFVFIKIKEKFPSQGIRLRFFVSTAFSIFLDTLIFSVLAWYYFTVNPLPWSVIWSTYIWETYLLRLILTLFNILFVQYFRAAINR